MSDTDELVRKGVCSCFHVEERKNESNDRDAKGQGHEYRSQLLLIVYNS